MTEINTTNLTKTTTSFISRVIKWILLYFLSCIITIVLIALLIIWKFHPLDNLDENGIKLLYKAITLNQTGSNTKTNFSLINTPNSSTYKIYEFKAINDLTIENFISHGKTEITNSTIKNNLEVYGNLYTDNSNFTNLSVYGTAILNNSTIGIHNNASFYGKVDFNNCTVQGLINVYGNMFSKHTSFNGDILVEGNLIILENSNIDTITIQKFKNYNNPIIKLLSNSKVKNIVFTEGNGLVELASNSKLEGEVQGGVIKLLSPTVP